MPQLYWIDSFAAEGLAGNPAGVCILDAPAPLTYMQGLAQELNLSETAFVHRQNNAWSLRWFTPSGAEVKLCGHATLAAGAALLDAGLDDGLQPICFQTLSGELRAWRRKDNGLMELDFPERVPVAAPVPDGMLAALGLMSTVSAARSDDDWLIEAEDEESLRLLSPEFARLKAAGGRGICVTAKADSGADFVSRFFAPAVGIDEDPVTGSAHCYLGPYWATRLGQTELVGKQLSRRGGIVHVSLKNGRAFLAGEAKIVFKGTCI